ncbi:hypothetical protein FNW02_33320 [Komarekiella sp. 'clone 1']|uniref:ATPase involved in DNA repair n=1 Tax=Komarekiella delphini-convector SJRDD-AB1 TaxID=2593771 RepID=A0AA40T411_9NOST|nr:hypothetical protein [Komarekiella delphini-convector]MBD6620528.1 hypothetical protein [Komarekiella delphini-convector SJRDD-AB1]
MLTLDRSETKSALDYANLNSSIQETFAAIDRFEWQASDELRLMRDNGYFQDGAYTSFEDYCESELTKHGGYRRVRDLFAAKRVVETLPEDLRDKITKPSQTRPLLRLVKTPDKLQQAVAIASQEKPFPTAADFAKAVQQVAPRKARKSKTQLCNSVTGERLRKEGRLSNNTITHGAEQINPESLPSFLFAKCVTVSSQSHSRYGESGLIEADAPNVWQQIVTFDDGEKLLINNTDLDAPSVPFPKERTYPPEYSEAIAQIKEQHQQELERLSQELRIGLQAEVSARAEAQVQEQIQSLQNLYKQQKEQNIQLQQRLLEMEGLRKLEIENQQLQQRIQELEHAVQQHPVQQWGNTMTQQATKVLNKQVKQALEKTIDLRSLAQEPPKENAQECLRLMGMALKNLASAMNNTQALEAAALILGSEPTQSAIAYRAEQLQMLPQAVSEIRRVLVKSGCTWQDYWAVAQEYEVIKQDYWAELSTEETDLITVLQNASLQSDTISVGSIVAHANPYRTLYVERGEVVEDLGEELVVAWDFWKEQSKKTDRYFRDELRFWQPQ